MVLAEIFQQGHQLGTFLGFVKDQEGVFADFPLVAQREVAQDFLVVDMLPAIVDETVVDAAIDIDIPSLLFLLREKVLHEVGLSYLAGAPDDHGLPIGVLVPFS